MSVPRLLYPFIIVCQCRTRSFKKKGVARDHAHDSTMTAFLVYLYGLLILSVSAYQFRSHNPLSSSQLKRVIELDPPQFSSVTDGHLGKLLIPRPCMSPVASLNVPSFNANI